MWFRKKKVEYNKKLKVEAHEKLNNTCNECATWLEEGDYD